MATTVTRLDRRRIDNFFFSTMAVLVLASVFAGFARTYYLAALFHGPPLPNLIVHIHGVVFTCWVLLFITQTSLVAAGRVDLHKRLGMYMFWLAVLMVILGIITATDQLYRFASPGSDLTDARGFYAVPLGGIVVFAPLVFFAYRERFHAAAHKRLMLIATISLTNAAFARLTGFNEQNAQYCVYAMLAVLVGYDLWFTGKIERATLWGSAFVVIVLQGRLLIGNTAPWQAFAQLMLNVARSFH